MLKLIKRLKNLKTVVCNETKAFRQERRTTSKAKFLNYEAVLRNIKYKSIRVRREKNQETEKKKTKRIIKDENNSF